MVMSNLLGVLPIATRRVMEVMVDGREHYGSEMSRLSRLSPGTAFTILERLASAGLLIQRWEDQAVADQERRSRRCYYRLAGMDDDDPVMQYQPDESLRTFADRLLKIIEDDYEDEGLSANLPIRQLHRVLVALDNFFEKPETGTLLVLALQHARLNRLR